MTDPTKKPPFIVREARMTRTTRGSRPYSRKYTDHGFDTLEAAEAFLATVDDLPPTDFATVMILRGKRYMHAD